MKPRRTNRLLRFLGRSLGMALVLTLVLTLLPYARDWASVLLLNGREKARQVSTLLSRQLQSSARLETRMVDEESQLVSTVDALLLGEVQRVTVQYRYHASLGIDLQKVQVEAQDAHIIIRLPPLELISDSLTPVWIDRQDFWYPLTDRRRQELLEKERQACGARCLEEANASQEAWREATEALNGTILSWLDGLPVGVSLQFE